MKTAMRSVLAGMLSMACSLQAADMVLVRTENDVFRALDEEGAILSFSTCAFGKNWGWMGVGEVSVEKDGDATRFAFPQDKGRLAWALGASPIKDGVRLTAQVSAKDDVELTYIAFSFEPGAKLQGGKAVVVDVHGVSKDVPIPIQSMDAKDLASISFFTSGGERLARVDVATPANAHLHGSARIKLVDATSIKAGQAAENTFTVTFDKPVRFYASSAEVPPQADHGDWFAFNPRNTGEAGALGMQDWLAIPQGPLQASGDQIVADGKPIRVWGTNVEYLDCKPPKEDAERRAAFFAKFGVNMVRQHKLTNPGWEGLGSTESASTYDPESLERFDYFNAQLRKNGVMYLFSPIWDLQVFAGDRGKLAAYDEIVAANPGKPTTKGLVWFAPDIQALHIETLVNLLDHRNPHTGLRYADDPALACVEIQNEECVFFYTTTPWVGKCPTYRKLFAELFSDWLKQRYGTHEALVAAWGRGAIDTFRNEGGFPGEHLEQRNIYPVGNPWMWDNQGRNGDRAPRLQDTARFLLACQEGYYAKAVAAIRKTGYKGLVVPGNWQAGAKTGHFLNLFLDAKYGVVDRHNYLGGAVGNPGHVMLSGHRLDNHTGLDDPGSALLSVGMQQVAGTPFSYSEWLAVPPVEWAAADTALMAAYGFGLQGWDMSFHFASNGNGFSPTLSHPGTKKFNNLTPVGFGLYPVLSRMVLRGDVAIGEPIATRRLTIDQAVRQDCDFANEMVQQHDIKSFSGTPHHNALAVGRVLVEFAETASPSSIGDWQKFRQGDTLMSSTGQLRWTAPGGRNSGFFSIDTPGTQGVAGFTGEKTFELSDVTIKTQSPYAVILCGAHAPTGSLAADRRVIIAAVARAHNTGMNLGRGMIFDVGTTPVIIEPVKAELVFRRPGGVVRVLDHDGNPTDTAYPLANGTFSLDTGRDKTIWYALEYP